MSDKEIINAYKEIVEAQNSTIDSLLQVIAALTKNTKS